MVPSDGSPVIALYTRVEYERGRWVVYADAVCIPETEEYVITHRISDHPRKEAAVLAAQWIGRTANKL